MCVCVCVFRGLGSGFRVYGVSVSSIQGLGNLGHNGGSHSK